MNLRLRPAKSADLLMIHEMDIESYGVQTTPITGLIWIVEKQGEKPNLFLQVAETDEGLVGFVAWKEIEGAPGTRKSMELLHLVIAKRFHTDDLARGFFSEVIQGASQRGLVGTAMTVPAQDARIVTLLKDLGFFEYRRLPGFFLERGDAIIFAQRLG